MAPELIEGVINHATFQCDVYGFSMSILELLTEQHPYANRKRDAAVIKDVVVNRTRPERPFQCRFLSDELWIIMQKSWTNDAQFRPNMTEISWCLKECHNASIKLDQGRSYNIDGDDVEMTE